MSSPNLGALPARAWVHSGTPARVEDILAKACDVLVRDGHAGFNLRKVAAEAGVRLATIQHHFANRETLLCAAITRVMRDWGRGYVRIVEKADRSPEQRLREVQDLSLAFLDEPSTAPLLLECFALAQHDDAVRKVVEQQYLEYRTLFAGLVQELRADMPADVCMAHATVFAAQMEGLVLLLRRGDPGRPDDALLRHALHGHCDAFVAGVRAWQPPVAARRSAKAGRSAKSAKHD